MTLYELISDPEIARLIELLYEGYRMPYDEILKELNIKQKKLNELLDATEGLWDTPSHHSYRLTERGKVAYGIIKSRNIRIKNNRDSVEKEISERPMEKLKTQMSPVKRFINTWKAVISKPSAFFTEVPTEGGYKEPLMFAIVCYIPFAVFAPFIGIPYLDFPALILPPLALLLGIIAIFAESIIVHAGVLIFARGKRKGFKFTLRVISFASATAVFLWIPIVGTLISLYGVYLGIVGLMKVHKTTRIRAVFAYFGLSTFIAIIGGAVAIYLIYTGMAETSVRLPFEIPEMPTI
jgi:hypothetical protein